ncbi:hypothetical protein N1M2_155 [Klebsiella phage N1M2]|uniref:Uncharacterized protein n=1 Tax=Klebsiella phage N1M2 TaxID=2664939 RepID=A0A6B7ZEV1_9CAUD|nr:hypothetical protein PQB72_gp155 [Klebsiella phage N1M2]QGH72018.1 hypothetical protein N1M2_155 [Klebsiella phage N1M2]
MKPVLTFTDLIINDEDGKYSIEMVATINREIVKKITRPIINPSAEMRQSVFQSALDGICLAAACVMDNRVEGFHYPAGMNLVEKLSLFDIKQTVTMANDLRAAGFDTNIIMAAIW